MNISKKIKSSNETMIDHSHHQKGDIHELLNNRLLDIQNRKYSVQNRFKNGN